LPGGAFTAEAIKVTLTNLRETISTLYTDSQGQFEFRNLASGNYQLEVEGDRQKYEVKTEAVTVFKGTPSVVNIGLKEKESPDRPSPKTVSITELDRNIPSNARKEFDRASKLISEGNTAAAIVRLQKAVELYPGYVMAHNDLGTQLLAQGKLAEATEELRKAVSLDAKAFNPALNLGIVLVHQHQFTEALAILRTANSLNPNSPAAQLYTGLAAMGLGDLEVAEKDFKAAHSMGGQPFAVALFHLGQLYLARGDKESALNAFTLYLREVPDAANAEQVRKTIAMLH
jgi:tetratricopeptide (TPR) repeat protein